MAARLIPLACLFAHAAADGHGVFCTTQFNWWFAQNKSAELTLLDLAKPYDSSLNFCDMQVNANYLYYSFKLRGGLGFPNGGGFDKTCTTPDASIGVPAGGCAFSYPVIANSTCRLKIFGPKVENELQWCQCDLPGTLRIAKGSDGSSNPDNNRACANHTDFDISGANAAVSPYMAKGILFNVFANTLVNICDPGARAGRHSSGTDLAAVVVSGGAEQDEQQQQHVMLALLVVGLVVACLSFALMAALLLRVSKLSRAIPDSASAGDKGIRA